MRLRFWGTRGSIAKPGPATVRYGGNTSCVEARSAAGTLLVLDCGTGAHGLGQALAAERTTPYRGHMLITHTHWDHIQGFPFFAPLFLPGDEWDVYAPRGLRESLRETLAGQMQYKYFPVSLEQFEAVIRYHDLVEGAFTIGDIRVTARYLNHPALTLGYRLEVDGVSVAYATDHEPHSRGLADGRGELDGEDRRHAEFLAGADLVIHDSQYTAAEYATKAGWGHSTVESVVTVARAAQARRLALFHHDPMRDDDALDVLVEAARHMAGSSVEVFAAAEGMTVDVVPTATPRGATSPAPLGATTRVPADMLAQTVLVGIDEPTLRGRLIEAVHADGLGLTTATDVDTVFEQARVASPSLILLGRRLGGRDGLEAARALRKAEAFTKDVPIVLVAAREDEADRTAGAEAGVTDWLVAPFSMLYARTRIRAWALRQACRWIAAPAPADEPARVRALHARGILDTPPEERFDRITRLARRLFDVPAALVTLVDSERQWFKSAPGLEIRETPRDLSFCSYTIHQDTMFVVPDALTDPRFADNPMVSGEPRLRFYAGRPVRIDGRRVGTLCVVDSRPRQLGDEDLQALDDLAALVEKELS
ncbi:MAG: phytochrome sensor protein [Candidatus Rokuibacteriota bacterium]|nr:MAG: phytochrome sensor protein [Candidatus Rokubacteria bacterium]